MDQRINQFLDNIIKGASNEELYKLERLPASKPFVGPPAEVAGVDVQPSTEVTANAKIRPLEINEPKQVAQTSDYMENVNRSIESIQSLKNEYAQERQAAQEQYDRNRADISSAYENLSKAAQPRVRTPEENARLLAAQEGLNNIQQMPERDVASELITSFGPALLGAFTGESGALAQLPATKQAREIYESRRKEKSESINKKNEQILKNYENILKIDKQAAEDYLNNQKLLQQQADVTFKGASTIGQMSQKDIQAYDQKIADLEKTAAAATQKGAEKVASIEGQPAKEAAKNKRAEMIATGKSLKDATALRKEFDSLPEIKDYKTITSAYKKMKTAVEKPSPAGDMSLVFSYMKVLDPTSTVREGEYDRALKTTGLPGQLRNALEQMKTGKFLSPEQRNDFLNQATEMHNAAQSTAAEKEQDFLGYAESYGAKPELIVPSRSKPLPTQRVLSERDKQALDWAKKNKGNEKAKQILELLGGE